MPSKTGSALAAKAIAFDGEGIQLEIDICLVQQAVEFHLSRMTIEEALAWVTDHTEALSDLASYSPVVVVRKLLPPAGGSARQAAPGRVASGRGKKRIKM